MKLLIKYLRKMLDSFEGFVTGIHRIFSTKIFSSWEQRNALSTLCTTVVLCSIVLIAQPFVLFLLTGNFYFLHFFSCILTAHYFAQARRTEKAKFLILGILFSLPTAFHILAAFNIFYAGPLTIFFNDLALMLGVSYYQTPNDSKESHVQEITLIWLATTACYELSVFNPFKIHTYIRTLVSIAIEPMHVYSTFLIGGPVLFRSLTILFDYILLDILFWEKEAWEESDGRYAKVLKARHFPAATMLDQPSNQSNPNQGLKIHVGSIVSVVSR